MTKRHYRLFLASPGDVAEERDAVVEIVEEFNLRDDKGVHVDVIRWEKLATPDAGRPQENIFENTKFEKIEIFVGIFWSRMGTPSGAVDPDTDEEYPSGTMEEVKKAVRMMGTGKIKIGRLMLYFCERYVSPNMDLDQLKKVQDFKKEIDQDKLALWRSFTSLEDFKWKLRVDLEVVWKTLEPDSPSPEPDLWEIEEKKEPTDYASKLLDLIITSNSEKNLPNAFLRRCVYYHVPFPSEKQLKTIVNRRFADHPGFTAAFVDEAVEHFLQIRTMSLKKKPATGEFLPWLGLLQSLKLDTFDAKSMNEGQREALAISYSILAKNNDDLKKLCRRVLPTEES